MLFIVTAVDRLTKTTMAEMLQELKKLNGLKTIDIEVVDQTGTESI
jgi:hypothetical protein